jgi:2'-5' RNA ligase
MDIVGPARKFNPVSPQPAACHLFLFCSNLDAMEKAMKKDAPAIPAYARQGVLNFYRSASLRPKRPERLFVGVFPDDRTLDRMERFRQQFVRENRLPGKPLPRERLHLSLYHVGDHERLRGDTLWAARRAMKAVSMPPFEVSFHAVMSLQGTPSRDGKARSRPLVLLSKGTALPELRQAVAAEMRNNGFRAASARFMPHITLLYGWEPVPCQAIEPIRFVVSELVLIHSELWRSRYNRVERRLLEGGPLVREPPSDTAGWRCPAAPRSDGGVRSA